MRGLYRTGYSAGFKKFMLKFRLKDDMLVRLKKLW